jgi:hypothetical protein
LWFIQKLPVLSFSSTFHPNNTQIVKARSITIPSSQSSPTRVLRSSLLEEQNLVLDDRQTAGSRRMHDWVPRTSLEHQIRIGPSNSSCEIVLSFALPGGSWRLFGFARESAFLYLLQVFWVKSSCWFVVQNIVPTSAQFNGR